jgi:hypothetical protein
MKRHVRSYLGWVQRVTDCEVPEPVESAALDGKARRDLRRQLGKYGPVERRAALAALNLSEADIAPATGRRRLKP